MERGGKDDGNYLLRTPPSARAVPSALVSKAATLMTWRERRLRADFVAEVGPMDRFQRLLTFQKLGALPLPLARHGQRQGIGTDV